MKLTPLDIQQQQFKVRFRGFDVREVDRFLNWLPTLSPPSRKRPSVRKRKSAA